MKFSQSLQRPLRNRGARIGAWLSALLLTLASPGSAQPPAAPAAPPAPAEAPAPKLTDAVAHPAGLTSAVATAKPTAPGTVEARFTDNSMVKLILKDEKIDLQTAYGKLSIPVSAVRRIEFARRTSPENTQRIDAAIKNLTSKDFHVREAASAELLAQGGHAYPVLIKIGKHPDVEAEVRIEEILKKLVEALPEDDLKMPANDVVHTDDSKITGRIEASTLKVLTTQFGEHQLKLADLRSLGNFALDDDTVLANVLPDPGNLENFQGQVGQKLAFRVTGAANAANGALWGQDIYTTDSSLALAAVHAGVLKPGQVGVVKVAILGPQNAFQGSTRNGVASNAFGNYPGSYKIYK